MTLLVVLTAVAILASGAMALKRLVTRLTGMVDAATAQIRGATPIPSRRMNIATDRLKAAAHEYQNAPPAERLERQRYQAALSSIPVGVVLLDLSGSTVYRNAFAASFIEGRHGDALVDQAIEEIAGHATGNTTAQRKLRLYGRPRRTLSVTARLIEERGDQLGALILIDDVTEQERIDDVRRDFVSNISHELRTPIGAVSLLAETVLNEDEPQLIHDLVTRIVSEADRMGQTVEDLLQLSRIEHGSDEGFETVVFQDVVVAAVDRVRAAAQQRNQHIGITMPDRDLILDGEAIQLTSAVFNLLENAVKYSTRAGGSISIRARRVGTEIELVVQDNGIGIPGKDLGRIFERFYRVDPGRSRASGGTGLGLAIVRHVVNNHGGRITVDSSEGEGSTFTMFLPALDDNPDNHPSDGGYDAGVEPLDAGNQQDGATQNE